MPLKWRKAWISDETFESAEVIDVNNDGVPDIVSGAYWYQGPDFRRKHSVGEVKRYGEYFDDFSTIPLDINGDGFTDFVTGGWWGNTLRWRENPSGDPSKQWTEHVIAEVGNVETTRAWDIDGEIEILPNTPNNPEVAYYKLITDQSGNGTGEFRKVSVYNFPEGKGQGHGLGCGDVAGNGRMDIVLCKGWLEAPENPEKGVWIWHEDFPTPPWGWSASIPMLVVDINGDGQPELVTGKRHRAHCGNEAGEWDHLGIYYFKWTGEGVAKQIVDYGPIGGGTGCGIHFSVADLNGDGRPEIIAPGKEGLYVFFNEGSE